MSDRTLPRRLIEVDLPIKRISAHARREKSIRHGHISTLHIWWARRPLAACRAVICASLWPDPADPACPQSFRETALCRLVEFARRVCGRDNTLHTKDLGLVHSSAAKDLVSLMLDRLKHDGDVEQAVSPTRLVKHWPAMTAWSTKGVRDAFFASPLLPRLLVPDSVRETISRGVENGILAYVGKGKGNRYEPFHFKESLPPDDVEISDDMFVVTAEEARKQIEPPRLTLLVVSPAQVMTEPGKKQTFTVRGLDQHGRDIAPGPLNWSATGGTIDHDAVFQADQCEGNFLITATAGEVKATASVTVARPGAETPKMEKVTPPEKKEPTGLSWEGEVPAQKWMNFYTKVLARFAASKGLCLTVHFELTGDGSVTQQKIEEIRVALRELGLDDTLRLEL